MILVVSLQKDKGVSHGSAVTLLDCVTATCLENQRHGYRFWEDNKQQTHLSLQ